MGSDWRASDAVYVSTFLNIALGANGGIADLSICFGLGCFFAKPGD